MPLLILREGKWQGIRKGLESSDRACDHILVFASHIDLLPRILAQVVDARRRCEPGVGNLQVNGKVFIPNGSMFAPACRHVIADCLCLCLAQGHPATCRSRREAHAR